MDDKNVDALEKVQDADLNQDQNALLAQSTAKKVYPTSFVPKKGSLELPKEPEANMSGHTIEGIHIVMFLGLVFLLFAAVWKRPNQR